MGKAAPLAGSLTPQQKLIYELADSGRGTVEFLDIGRGERRRRCLGIVTENVDACMERAAARGLQGARHAVLGLRGVVYWPEVPTPGPLEH